MIIQEWFLGTFLWEEADMRMVTDDFGELVFVPFCLYEHDWVVFEAI